MNEKNWRENVFIFGMIAVILYVILTSIAMLFYAGGTHVDHDAPGYSFWANWFSDLGRTKGFSGKDNTVSMVIFIIAMSVNGISRILFAIAFKFFFTENKVERRLSKVGTVFLIIYGVTFIGTAFTPYDISYTFEAMHYIFANVIATLTAFIGYILYIVAIFHNKKYPNKYAFALIVALAVSFISSIILSLFAVPIEEVTTAEELIWHTGLQKITTYIIMSVGFYIFYGAWKQIKS